MYRIKFPYKYGWKQYHGIVVVVLEDKFGEINKLGVETSVKSGGYHWIVFARGSIWSDCINILNFSDETNLMKSSWPPI